MTDAFTFHDPAIGALDLSVFDARQAPFTLHGLYKPQNGGLFRRMPEDVAARVSPRVHYLHTHPAGARLRFTTNSSVIAVGATVEAPPDDISSRTAAYAPGGAFGFSLYADGKLCRAVWQESFIQHGAAIDLGIGSGRFEGMMNFGEGKPREITLCLPYFLNISALYIGLDKDASLTAAKPYVNEKPVVFYGSSITQGCCASHPGNIYQNILSRRLNIDYLNLGFSGAAKAEDAIVDYLCTLDPCMMVFDYDHNAKTPEALAQTHLPALRKLRAAHPEIPFILLSRPDCAPNPEEVRRRIEVVEASYRALLADGCGPVHFINGMDIFHSHDPDMMILDGTHPTDFGFYCMAEALYAVMKPYFT